jgi:hypothetical protein
MLHGASDVEAGSCELNNDPLGSIKGWEFLD